MAELVDALVSGTSGSNVVGVQVSPSALFLFSKCFYSDSMVKLRALRFFESVDLKNVQLIEGIMFNYYDYLQKMPRLF